MNPSDAPNPEHRSNNALLCFCIGAGLSIGAYFLGIGTVIATLLSGGDPALMLGGVFAAIALGLLGVSGVILTLIGGVWMIIRVIADQRGDNEKRYRNVNR